MTYTVIYWMGGTEVGQWRRCLPVATKAEAVRQVGEIEAGGRCAHYNRTEVWDAIGLPEGAPVRWLRNYSYA